MDIHGKSGVWGELDSWQVLLENGADVNAKRNDGWTALLMAVKEGHLAVMEPLLEKDADDFSPKGTHSPRRSMEGGDPETGVEDVEVLEDDARLGRGGHF